MATEECSFALPAMTRTSRGPSRVVLTAAVLVAAVVVPVDLARAAGTGATYAGKPVPIGHGTAQVIVRADADGKPVAIAVKLSRGALEGLPDASNKDSSAGQWEYALPMPESGPKTGYRHVVVDWNPQGHPPPHVYTVPHFDFHFYLTSADEVAHVAFSGAADPATRVADAGLVAPGYKVVPDAAVNKMGVHAIDTRAPEFQGKPFTATFIYGYDKGRLTFVEPMVTRDFLLKQPKFSQPVRRPKHYSFAAWYPSRYRVSYVAGEDAYQIELNGLKRWAQRGAAQ